MSPEHPRSRLYVDQSVQGAILRRIAAHWCGFVAMGFGVGLLIHLLAPPYSDPARTWSAFWWSQAGYLFALIFLTPVVLCDIMRLSNRFAGPVFRLRDAMRRVSRGEDPRDLRFRENDFWTELADDFNALADEIRTVRVRQSGTDQADSQHEESTEIAERSPAGV